MAHRVALDTTFLIDLHRERGRDPQAPRPAHRYLESAMDVELCLPAVALGEFAEGFDDPDHPVLRVARELHECLEVDEPTALAYGRIVRTLREEGQLLGGNDLWIAATCLRHELPLVTANRREFQRVVGLEVVGYREETPG